MTHIKAQLLDYLKRASYGKSKLLLLGTSLPCTIARLVYGKNTWNY